LNNICFQLEYLLCSETGVFSRFSSALSGDGPAGHLPNQSHVGSFLAGNAGISLLVCILNMLVASDFFVAHPLALVRLGIFLKLAGSRVNLLKSRF
jgi:hypothetical protein